MDNTNRHLLPKGAMRIIRVGATCNSQARDLVSTTTLWMSCSGLEWTVGRLKAYREIAYQLSAGNAGLAKEILQANSISYNKSSLIPKGCWGRIVSGYVSARKPSVMRKYDAMLRLYTSMRCNHLTQKQLLKTRSSITGAFTGDPEMVTNVSRDLENLAKKFAKFFQNPIGEDGKVVVDLSRLSPTSATHIQRDVLYGGDNPLRSKSWGKHVCSIWTSVYIPDSLKAINPAEKLRELLVQSGSDNTVAGHLSVIQEGGCKGRVVAVPNAWEQILFRPLHMSLAHFAKRVHTSCVHDQNKGAYFIRDAIIQGEKVYSIDLSSATDRFPLQLQVAVLRGLGCPQYAEALEEIAKAPWVAPDKSGTWSYSVGQPMGLYGSFSLFHITHLLLLEMCLIGIRKRTGLPRESIGTYMVLGDDVVMTGAELSSTYTRILKGFGVDTSPGKCIESPLMGEFAGFVCRKTNKSVTVHRPFKYSGEEGFGSPLSLLNSFGKDVRKLGPYWARKYEVFCHTKPWRNPDLSPILAKEDDQPSRVNLNSHLLGSLSNRLNYCLDFNPVDELNDVYEGQQIILLGQKEKVRDGFASANANVELATGVKNSEVAELESGNGFKPQASSAQLSTDPLMRSFSNMSKPELTSEVADTSSGSSKTSLF